MRFEPARVGRFQVEGSVIFFIYTYIHYDFFKQTSRQTYKNCVAQYLGNSLDIDINL